MTSTRPDRTPARHQVIDLAQRSSGRITASQQSAVDPGATARVDGTTQREAARQAYRDSIAAGQPLSGQALATRFGYSRSWGRDRINEVRAETTQAAAATLDHHSERPDGPHLEETSAAHDDSADLRAHEGIGHGREQLAPPDEPRTTGRRVAWLAFVVGIATSVAANVMHAQIVSTSPAAWIGAAFWPIALLLAIEVLARVSWPQTSPWVRLARHAGASIVAIVAGVLSYRHMAGLLAAWGEDILSAYLGPLAIDGLMLLAAAALLITAPERHPQSDSS